MSASREVCESQETSASLAADCASLEVEIDRLVNEKYKAELRLVQVEEGTQQLHEVAKKYREKMISHKMKTKEMESSLPAYRELEEARKSVQTLRDRSEHTTHTHTRTHTHTHTHQWYGGWK